MDDDTVITSFRVIRAWLNFCVNEELITASPMRKVKAPTLPKEILPAFAPEDVRKLLSACRRLRDTAMVLYSGSLYRCVRLGACGAQCQQPGPGQWAHAERSASPVVAPAKACCQHLCGLA
jgi:hypothetical protein